VVHRTSYTDPYRDNFPSQPNMPLPQGSREVLSNNVFTGEVVVPAGQYFVMGDNRADSLDSRYLGFVPVGDIVGRPVLIYASYEDAGHPHSAPP
jgi:signal peptidase I